MRIWWPWRWRTTYQTVLVAGPPATAGDLLTAEQRGNVTAAHRMLLEQLAPGTHGSWSERALWSCLNRLRSGTGAGAEIRVENAWTDGPDAFCIVCNPPYQPTERVGLRRHVHDDDPADHEPDVGPHYAAFLSPIHADVGSDGEWDPVLFGQAVADYDIGEPLGHANDLLRADSSGVGWWGALFSLNCPINRSREVPENGSYRVLRCGSCQLM